MEEQTLNFKQFFRERKKRTVVDSERTKNIIPLLGVELDIAIARQFGISRERIRQIRKKRGIPKAIRSKEYTIPEEDLCTLSIKKLCSQYQANEWDILKLRKKYKINKGSAKRSFYNRVKKVIKKRLGRVTDAILAKEGGINSITVGKWRKELGIKKAKRTGLGREERSNFYIAVKMGEKYQELVGELKTAPSCLSLVEKYGINYLAILRIKKKHYPTHIFKRKSKNTQSLSNVPL